MKNILTLTFVLFNLLAWSQLKIVEKEVLAQVKMEKIKEIEKIDVVQLDLKASIQKGFKTGNANLIAAYFLPNVDISMLNKENLYSKSQGEQVLKTFFMEHKPVNFSYVHEGKLNNMKYFIGTLSTAGDTFRITVNIKMVSGVEQISHLTIEKED